jgi:hypothetical protein
MQGTRVTFVQAQRDMGSAGQRGWVVRVPTWTSLWHLHRQEGGEEECPIFPSPAERAQEEEEEEERLGPSDSSEQKPVRPSVEGVALGRRPQAVCCR